jgi:hypothetical protein
LRILNLLECLPEQKVGQEDLLELAAYYRDHKSENFKDFKILYEEITSSEADFGHIKRYGSQRFPNPIFCPVCELKLKDFHLIAPERAGSRQYRRSGRNQKRGRGRFLPL